MIKPGDRDRLLGSGSSRDISSVLRNRGFQKGKLQSGITPDFINGLQVLEHLTSQAGRWRELLVDHTRPDTLECGRVRQSSTETLRNHLGGKFKGMRQRERFRKHDERRT